MKKVDIISNIVARKGEALATPSKVNLSGYLLKSIWDKVWEVRTDSQGIEYIFGKLPVVTQYGITMYSGDGVDVPSLASGLPFDGRTIWYNPETQQIEVIGGTGGGNGEGVSNFWDLSGIPSWITNSKPKYTYTEIEGTPDLSGYATQSWVENKKYLTAISSAMVTSALGFTPFNAASFTKSNIKSTLGISDWALAASKPSYTTSEVSEGTNLYFTNARAVSALTETLKSYVTLGGTQTITGEKNFTGGLKVNDSLIYYDKEKKYWKLEGDLLVTGGVTMYGSDSSFVPSTIMDAILYDDNTLGINSNGELYVKGGTSGGGLDITALQNYLTQNSYLNVTSGDNRYLQLSGGTLSNSYEPLSVKRLTDTGASFIRYHNNEGLIGTIGVGGSASSFPYDIYFQNKGGSSYKIWHEGNDGSGSTLDADLLDGKQPSELNVGSATKLQTARTIWGQSFDGTGDVSGTLNLGASSVRWHNSNSYSISCPTTSVSARLQYHADDGHIFKTAANTNAITILRTGNVGFGTTNPAYKLDVNGALNATTIYQNGQTLANTYLPLSGGRLSSNDANILELYRTNGQGGAWIDFYAANQSSIYWRVGSSNEHTFRWEYTSGVISMTLNSLGVLSTKGFESLYANIGYVFGHQDVSRAIISVISTADSPAEVILGGSSVNYWSMTSRGTSQTSNYWLYNYNKKGTNLEADYNSFSVRIGKGNQSPYEKIDSSYTLDVCGKTRTTSLYGASEQLNIIAASGYNATLRSNGGASGYNVALDTTSNSLRPFADSHLLLDLGSSNIYWRNTYSQKLILKSPSADALSIYRTISGGGAFVDFYPSDQTENYWRIGALNDYNCSFLFNGDANTNHVSIAPQGHLSVGHTLSHTSINRAELSVVSIKNEPCDIMLGSNQSAHWSISSRDSSMNNNLIIHSYQGTKMVFEINKDGCCRIGKNSSWTAPTSTITLDVLGSTRTNNIYGTNVNLALISATGTNVELQANGQLAGYKVCLDVATKSFRPFADSHALIDLGSEKVYWKNIYAQKCILTSNDAGALSLYRTNEYGVYIDYYPSNQKVNKWRVGASQSGVFQWENYNGKIVGRFASSDTTGTRFEVGKSFLNYDTTGTDVNRAVITLISESDHPADIIMGANKYAWSITTRSSTEDYLLGFYSALSSQYAMKIYKEGNVLVTGGITMYSDQRKKTILSHVELSLKDIANAPLIEHYYNSDESKTSHVGSIAQYWASMNDWFCKLDSEGYYTMEIQNAALASAISIARELDRYETKTDKAIKKLKKRICELEEEVERLKRA